MSRILDRLRSGHETGATGGTSRGPGIGRLQAIEALLTPGRSPRRRNVRGVLLLGCAGLMVTTAAMLLLPNRSPAPTQAPVSASTLPSGPSAGLRAALLSDPDTARAIGDAIRREHRGRPDIAVAVTLPPGLDGSEPLLHYHLAVLLEELGASATAAHHYTLFLEHRHAEHEDVRLDARTRLDRLQTTGPPR